MHKKIDSSIGMSYFGVVFDAGGIWEEDGRRGCSHLMEHLMCKTYEYTYPKMRRLDVVDNAITTDNKVVFFASGLNECMAQLSQTMLDELIKQKNMWTEEQFNTEKMIVLQEYGDSFNDQLSGTYENAMREKYNYCSAIGFRKDIEEFTYEDSIQMAKDVFSVPRMIVTVGDHSIKYDGQYKSKTPNRKAKFGNYDLELEKTPKENQSVVALLRKNPVDKAIATTYTLLKLCLSEGLESPLYQEIREKRGLAYAVYCTHTLMGHDIVPIVLAQTANENSEKLVTSFNEFFSKSMGELISEDRFNDCKEGMLFKKKKAEILPHQGVLQTVIADFNPFDGLEEVSREDVINLGNEVFNVNEFEVIKS